MEKLKEFALHIIEANDIEVVAYIVDKMIDKATTDWENAKDHLEKVVKHYQYLEEVLGLLQKRTSANKPF